MVCPNKTHPDYINLSTMGLEIGLTQNEVDFIWSINEGMPLNRLPDGSPSPLYHATRMQKNLTPEQTIRSLMPLYTPSTIQRTGNWPRAVVQLKAGEDMRDIMRNNRLNMNFLNTNLMPYRGGVSSENLNQRTTTPENNLKELNTVEQEADLNNFEETMLENFDQILPQYAYLSEVKKANVVRLVREGVLTLNCSL